MLEIFSETNALVFSLVTYSLVGITFFGICVVLYLSIRGSKKMRA